MNGRLNISPTPEALAQAAAQEVSVQLCEAVDTHGRAVMALSGGMTPRSVYELLASDVFRARVPWESVHVFWGDERCVPPEHPDSNFKMANDALLRHVDIPASHIHRIHGESKPEHASLAYEEEIRRMFNVDRNTIPVFDLILLGLGDDGHTASLFPGTSALSERERLVTGVFVQSKKTYRVTLTYPVINRAHHVLFLVSGKGKAAILADVLQSDTGTFPAQLIRPVGGDLQWLVDQDAASQLEPMHNP